MAGELTDELGDPANTYEQITNFNNFYEFTTDKEKVAEMSADFPTRPWTVEVGGLVNKPGIFGIEDILSTFTSEERIYRMRCVEGWSMVIPWFGFQLSKLLEQVEPTSRGQVCPFRNVAGPCPDARPDARTGSSGPMWRVCASTRR